MAQQRLPVRKIREVLRLRAEGISDRQIAVAIGCARSTVQDCVRRCREAGLVWPLPVELTEETLYGRLYFRQVPLSKTPAPDFARLHAELTLADAILDRLVHNSYRLALTGASMRKQKTETKKANASQNA